MHKGWWYPRYRSSALPAQLQYFLCPATTLPQISQLVRLTSARVDRYNKLFTVTAQCRESELPRFRPVLQATVDSFVPPAPEY
jgi:hypothetical protein